MPRKTRTRTKHRTKLRTKTNTSKPKKNTEKRKQAISQRRNKKGGESIDDNDNKIIAYLNDIFTNNPVKIYNTNFFIVVSNTVPKCVVSDFNVQTIILQNVEMLNEIKEQIRIMKCPEELGSVTSVILLLRGKTPIGSFCIKTENEPMCKAQNDYITAVYNSIIQKTNGNVFP